MTPFQLNDWMRSDTWEPPTFDDADLLKPSFDVSKDPGFLSMDADDFLFPEVAENTSSFHSDSVSSSYDDAMTDTHHCDSITSSPTLSDDDHSFQETSLQSAHVQVSELLSEPQSMSPVPDVSLLLQNEQVQQHTFSRQLQTSTSQYFCPTVASAGLLASTFPLQQAALTCADLLANQAANVSIAGWPLATQLQKTLATNALAALNTSNYLLNAQLSLLQPVTDLLQPVSDFDSLTTKAQAPSPATESAPSIKADIKSQGSSSGPLSALTHTAQQPELNPQPTEIKSTKAKKTTVIIHKPPAARAPCPKRTKLSPSLAPSAEEVACPSRHAPASSKPSLAFKATPCTKPQRLLQRSQRMEQRQASGVAAAVAERRAAAQQLPPAVPAVPSLPKLAAGKAEAQPIKAAGPKKPIGKRKHGKKSSRKGIPRKSQDVVCLNCGTQQTPQWRRGPDGPRTLCNACGVRFKKGLPLPYLALKPAVAPAAEEPLL